MMKNPNTLPHPSKTSTPAQDIKVLLGDDDAFQRELIAGTLESLGVHQITQAASGDLALQKLTPAHGFNLLLLDLHMPGIDGFQFMEALVNTHYAGALIIVSGQSDEVMHAASMVAKLRRFNVLGSVPKPVGRAALSALLDKIMQ